MKRALGIVLAVFALAACDDKKTENKPEDPSSKNATTGASATATATTTATPTTVAINDSDLSTPADFEEKAEKDITKTTYKQDLASIESDIGKDKE